MTDIIITLAVLGACLFTLCKVLQLIERFARRLFDKARGISTEERRAAEEQKKLANTEQIKEFREGLASKRKDIQKQMKPNSGDQFQAWVTVVTTVFLIFISECPSNWLTM